MPAGAIAPGVRSRENTGVRLRQINIDYDAEHDRLLMRIGTSDGAELRLWLTRRYVKLLWPLLVKLAEDASPRIRTQANPEARKALLGLEHEQALARADFSRPYENKTPKTPLGESPLLLSRIQTGHDRNGQPIVALHPSDGQGVTLNLDAVLLHSLCRLIQAAAQKSDWDIELRLPGSDSRPPTERVQRTIN
ncbi:MAG: hypothetical protein R3357_03940 [Burkholderiales bacterium]|nr:hypothetical protein [Burkholderiales bacterium]